MSSFKCDVILFSRSEETDSEIITTHLRYPRMIHSELMTHRVFSRNARSSRAVPVSKLLKEDIYTPTFMKNKSGMQASEEFDEETLLEIQCAWKEFAQKTQEFSKWLADKGVHKQWANRPTEWFGWIDTLVTSTSWENWFKLRLHIDAMPEIRYLSALMVESFYKAEPQVLKKGEWHIPYDSPDLGIEERLKLSVARCARVSYAPFDGNASLEKEFQRFELLRDSDPIHASPFEHQAKNATEDDYIRSNLEKPWLQYRKLIEQK